MGSFFKTFFGHIADLFLSPVKRNLILIIILVFVAVSEFFYFGLARRTFVFYTISDGTVVVEDRMLNHSDSREGDIIRYVEETLLGPVSPDLLPLFPKGTRLKSLLYRDGVVYSDLTINAALPPIEGGSSLKNFQTFYDSILRNFSYVKDVRFFIEGNAVFTGEFHPDFSEI